MAARFRILAALAALIVIAAVATGCGGGVPGNGVARIDDAVIKKSTFEHWLEIAARSSLPPGSTVKVVLPKPPDFDECVADKRKTASKLKGSPKQTTKQLKAACKSEYEGQRDQVMQFLISNEWLKGEAKDMDIKISQKEIDKEYEKQKKQSFPAAANFARFLKSSGYVVEDLKLRVEQDLLTNKIRTKVQKIKKPSEAQLSAYYDKNKSRFGQPESRDLQVVLTKTKAKADQARQRIGSGESFKTVAKALSIDQASKSQGGKLPAVIKGQQEKAFDDAIFAAKRGALTGPVKTQFGYYVFRVTKIKKRTQQTLDQAKTTIVQLLKSQKQQAALDKFVKRFEKKWKKRTDCRKGFVVQSCKNAKKPAATTGASGVQPQQAPQNVPPAQQVPVQPGG